MGKKSLPPPWLSVLCRFLVCPCAHAYLCLNEASSGLALLSQEGSVMLLVRRISFYVVWGTGICSFPAGGGQERGAAQSSWHQHGLLSLVLCKRKIWGIFSVACPGMRSPLLNSKSWFLAVCFLLGDGCCPANSSGRRKAWGAVLAFWLHSGSHLSS